MRVCMCLERAMNKPLQVEKKTCLILIITLKFSIRKSDVLNDYFAIAFTFTIAYFLVKCVSFKETQAILIIQPTEIASERLKFCPSLIAFSFSVAILYEVVCACYIAFVRLCRLNNTTLIHKSTTNHCGYKFDN